MSDLDLQAIGIKKCVLSYIRNLKVFIEIIMKKITLFLKISKSSSLKFYEDIIIFFDCVIFIKTHTYRAMHMFFFLLLLSCCQCHNAYFSCLKYTKYDKNRRINVTFVMINIDSNLFENFLNKIFFIIYTVELLQVSSNQLLSFGYQIFDRIFRSFIFATIMT